MDDPPGDDSVLQAYIIKFTIGPNLFRTDHKNFGLDQKILKSGQTAKFSTEKSFTVQSKILWTVTKYFGPIDIRHPS